MLDLTLRPNFHIKPGSEFLAEIRDLGESNGGREGLFLTEHHIYGSSRLGMERKNLEILEEGPILERTFFENQVGDKRYELSNHLGNVLSVVTDRKISNGEGRFGPDVIAYNDYYPFGMLLPNRHGNSSDYRYAFNGKELDNEIKGEGVQYDYGFRIYDARISRFLSEDPLSDNYAFYTPYQFAGNKPISSIDLDGLEERVVHLFKNENDNIVQVTIDSKDLHIKTELVGVQNSARYAQISSKDWGNIKQQLWDSFSSTPEMFDAQGEYMSYTLGMRGNESFNGLNQGTLTISSYNGNNSVFFNRSKVVRDGVDWKLYGKAIKTFNFIWPVPDPSIDGSEKFTQTVENVQSAAGIVLGGETLLAKTPSLLEKGIAGLGIIAAADDLTLNEDGSGQTILEKSLGEKKIQTVKAGITVINISQFMRNIALKGERLKVQDVISTGLDIKSGIKATLEDKDGNNGKDEDIDEKQ
ncbi:RHS repeat domain-containing protein [Ulvibacterium marinum]|uniref:RHS repeat domain-containing protein n=1 Tax=Ulvibacterium marinum TaxID=2419782 RepID=UPI002494DD8F|nr:RHS repeat-associated core domain-containing protein [Ulvibacterium marinum]